MSDASDTAMGAVLQQLIDGCWCPTAFFSRKLNTAESEYSAFDHELVVIFSHQKFLPLVKSQEFHNLTDHKPLTFALATKSPNLTPCQFPHLDYISQFTFDICYTKGCDNPVADALSRMETNALHRYSYRSQGNSHS